MKYARCGTKYLYLSGYSDTDLIQIAEGKKYVI